MMQEKTIVVAVQLGREEWLAIEICVKGSDLYLNYFKRDGERQAHASYHASGQYHIKTGGGYACWKGAGPWKQMKQYKSPPGAVTDRESLPAIGWPIGALSSVLPYLRREADMIVDASDFPRGSVLAFEVSVVDPGALERTEVTGFPIIQRCRFSNGISVEIEAFLVKE